MNAYHYFADVFAAAFLCFRCVLMLCTVVLRYVLRVPAACCCTCTVALCIAVVLLLRC